MQTIKDNVSLLTPEVPESINLLLDAMRKVITLLSLACSAEGLSDWRQSEHNKRKLKKAYRKAQKLKRSTSKGPGKKTQRDQAIQEAYLGYLILSLSFLNKAAATLKKLSRSPLPVARVLAIERYMTHAHRQIEQVYRRVILGGSIDHDEKVFSVFEEHTEWISKGKAGVPQEPGRKICIVEDQYGFIIHHKTMTRQTDQDITVPFTRELKALFPDVAGCSFDKGFYSPDNVKELGTLLDQIVLPKK